MGLRVIGKLLTAIVVLSVIGQARAQVDSFQLGISAAEVRKLQQAKALRKSGKTKEAISVLRDVVSRQPDYFNAQYELGLAISDNLENIADAIPPLEKAAAIKRVTPSVTDAHIFNSLGWAYMYTGRKAEAEKVLKEAEASSNQLAPDAQRRLYNNLGFLYLNKGNTQAAESYLRIAAEKYGSTQARQNLKTLEAVNKQGNQ